MPQYTEAGTLWLVEVYTLKNITTIQQQQQKSSGSWHLLINKQDKKELMNWLIKSGLKIMVSQCSVRIATFQAAKN